MKSYQQRTYYELLGLRVNASVDEIRQAYQRISQLDDAACLRSYQLENASDLLKLRELLCEAVEFLTDPEIRVEYDRSLTLAAAESAERNNAESVQPHAESAEPDLATIAQLDGTENAECDPPERAEHNPAEHAEHDHPQIVQLEPIQLEANSAERNPATTAQLHRGAETAERNHAQGAENDHTETIQLDGAKNAERDPATTAQLDRGAETPERSDAEGAENDHIDTIQLDGAESSERDRATTAQLDRGTETPERIHPGKAEGTHPDRAQHREREHTEAAGLGAAASAERARTQTAERDATKGGKLREATRADRDPLPEPAQLSFPGIFARESILRQPPPLPVVSYVPRSTPADAFYEDGPSSTRPAEAGPRQPHENLDNAPVLAEESALASAEAALALVSARVQQFRRPLEITADAEFNGELLRRVRESQGLALQQLCERTRVSIKHLENIEADRYGALPATVYLRGILISLARELKLDPVRVARSYIAAATVAREGKDAEVSEHAGAGARRSRPGGG